MVQLIKQLIIMILNNFKINNMITFKKTLIFLSFFLLILVSCTKNDVFTGSPNDTTIEKINLNGKISSTVTNVVSGQPFSLTVILPNTFDVDVLVEATSFIKDTNKKNKGTITIPAGQTTGSFQMKAPSADTDDLPYNLNMQVYLTAITTDPKNTSVGFYGKQYTISSNILDIDFGQASLAAPDHTLCDIRVDCIKPNYQPGLTVFNGLKYSVIKNSIFTGSSSIPSTPALNSSFYGTTNPKDPYLDLKILNEAKDGSSTDGTYIIKLYAAKLVSPIMDVPVRFTVRFPDETAETFFTIIPSMSITTGTINQNTVGFEKLQIIKSTNQTTGAPVYIPSLIP